MAKLLAYKGFACNHDVLMGFSFGGAASAVQVANEWIKANNITVLNVETMINVRGFTHSTSIEQDNVRVWHLVDNEADAGAQPDDDPRPNTKAPAKTGWWWRK